MTRNNNKKVRALIIVDMQNDFVSGSLPVCDAEKIVALINLLTLSGHFDVIVYTQDWHPENHCSFEENGGQWPKHCVADTWGAEFLENLELLDSAIYIKKGTRTDKDAYSGFDGTGLAEQLNARDVTDTYVVGLATDVCDRATALDSANYGFNTHFVVDASRGVDAAGIVSTVADMVNAGIHITTTKGTLS